MKSLNESEKAENFKIIDNMNKRVNFLRNPRFKMKGPIITLDKAGGKFMLKEEEKDSPFIADPKLVTFSDYQINGVYEISLKIVNQSNASQKLKYIPPRSEHFSIRRVKKPSEEVSNIAPGMSVVFNVVFQAPSFANFDDVLTIVTKDNTFDVPIRARREPPIIKLVNPMDSKACWIGDKVDMVFRCMNTGGDGGFKFFCEKDEDDNQQDEPETIKIGPFTLIPSEFYLYNGNAIDIFVSF
jgi:hypothetical protein